MHYYKAYYIAILQYTTAESLGATGWVKEQFIAWKGLHTSITVNVALYFLHIFYINTVSHSYMQYLYACQIWEKSLN